MRFWKQALITAAMLLVCSLTAFAAETITSGAASLDLADGSIVITQDGSYTVFTQGSTIIRTTAGSGIIRQSNSTTATANTIAVNSGTVAIVISGLNVSALNAAPIYVEDDAILNLTLVGTNSLTAEGSTAGISVCRGATLYINGTGSLDVVGGNNSAGIGGDGYSDGGNITIDSGVVNTTAGQGGAGIGGGRGSDGGNITISGGTVVSYSGDYITGHVGAGIGGGEYGDGGVVTITGGNVTAIATRRGAGIGGSNGGNGAIVTITGGVVDVRGGTYGTGIGGAYGGSGGSIIISNATVTVNGGMGGNGEGCDKIAIDTSATVTASYYREKIKIIVPSQNSAALIGKAACFSVDAYGYSGLSYQWQESSNKSTWTDVAGQPSAVASIPVTSANDGYYYRCKLTNGWGNVVYTNSAQAYLLAFTQQPQDTGAELNDFVTLSVTPSCENVTYQWQRSYNDGASWTDVAGEHYQTLLLSTTLSENNALYRCVITASNGDQLASDAARITVNSTAITYTTDYYCQKADGSGYELADRIVTESTAGAHVTAPEKTYEHFAENTAKGIVSGTVAADNSLILSRYYDRKSYTISFEMNGGAAEADISALYGAAVSAPPNPTRAGYVFAGWYADTALTEPFAFSTMPGENSTVYAKWTVLGEGRGIEYKITGISLLDDSYRPTTVIPDGRFYAEVSVKNLSSSTMDTLLLAAYDANGRLLEMHFLRANPPIGYTFVLGVGLDNSSGDMATLKAFMLPALGGVVPLAEAVELHG